jgi:hypothetical protein
MNCLPLLEAELKIDKIYQMNIKTPIILDTNGMEKRRFVKERMNRFHAHPNNTSLD